MIPQIAKFEMLSRKGRPQKILVGVDGSEYSMCAADYAIPIAHISSTKLVALYDLFSELGYSYSYHVLEFATLTVMK